MSDKIKQLKSCKSITQLYKLFGLDWTERVAFFLLVFLTVLPLFSLFSHVFWEYGKSGFALENSVVMIWSDYQRMIMLVGELSLIVVIIYIIGQFVLYKKEFLFRLKKSVWNIAFLSMLVWSIPCTFLSDNINQAFQGDSYRYEGLITYFFYASFFILPQIIKSPKYKKIIFRTFTIVACIISVIVILQDVDTPFFTDYFLVERAAVFFQFNHLGYYLCLSIMCLIGLYVFEEEKNDEASRKIIKVLNREVNLTGIKYLLWKFYYAFALFLQMYAIFVNSTLGSYLGVLVGLLAVIIFVCIGCKNKDKCEYRRLKLNLIIPISIIILTTFMSYMEWIPTSSGQTMRVNIAEIFADTKSIAEGDADGAGHGRVAYWKVGIKMILEKPIFGFGPDCQDEELMKTIWCSRIDNEVLQYAVFLGIPGALMYVFGLISLMITRFKQLRKLPYEVFIAAGCVFGYFFSSMLGNSMFYTAPYFWMFLGVVAQYNKLTNIKNY